MLVRTSERRKYVGKECQFVLWQQEALMELSEKDISYVPSTLHSTTPLRSQIHVMKTKNKQLFLGL
jgi:hypothetical protein